MSKKVIIFIWEWKSEYAFFESFIMRVLSNNNCIPIKNNILLEWWNYYILFAHPRMWASHKWWDSQLIKAETYIQIKWKISSHSHILEYDHDTSFTYILFTDEDNWSSVKISQATSLINEYCSQFIGNIIPVIPKVMIETWFICWIWNDILSLYPDINKTKLQKTLKSKDIEKVEQTKIILLEEIINKTELWGWWQQRIIWREFWDYIDIETTKKLCPSFKKFIEDMESIFNTSI